MSARWGKGGGGWKSFLEITGQRGGVGSSLEGARRSLLIIRRRWEGSWKQCCRKNEISGKRRATSLRVLCCVYEGVYLVPG